MVTDQLMVDVCSFQIKKSILQTVFVSVFVSIQIFMVRELFRPYKILQIIKDGMGRGVCAFTEGCNVCRLQCSLPVSYFYLTGPPQGTKKYCIPKNMCAARITISRVDWEHF